MSITKASEELYISQPSLSKTLSKLEKNLGYTLFDRQNNKMVLNGHGKVFFEYAQDITERSSILRSELAMVAAQKNNTLRVGTSNYLFVLNWINHLITNERIIVKHRVDTEENLKSKLSTGELDLVISIHAFPEKTFQSQHLVSDQIVVLLREDHPFALYEKLTPQQLSTMDYVALPSEFSGTRFLDILAQKTNITPHIVFEGET